MENKNTKNDRVTGRFAPSPTGRMHAGNVLAALLSWASARSRGGRWILRIEDLDTGRSRHEHALQIQDDLCWLGLDWDEGGTADLGAHGPYSQSKRGEIYRRYLDRLHATGLTYPCSCRRADIMATQAPHQSDGRIVYAGTCRPAGAPPYNLRKEDFDGKAVRIYVPDSEITFTDGICGPQCVNLSRECGDFVLRRADGAFAYQLAVVVDDALMGVTEVVRGNDLLLSAAQQIYLYRLLGFEPPRFVHIPLLCNSAGVRLSKRDGALGMESLRRRYTAPELIGALAYAAGLTDSRRPMTATELAKIYGDVMSVSSRSGAGAVLAQQPEIAQQGQNGLQGGTVAGIIGKSHINIEPVLPLAPDDGH